MVCGATWNAKKIRWSSPGLYEWPLGDFEAAHSGFFYIVRFTHCVFYLWKGKNAATVTTMCPPLFTMSTGSWSQCQLTQYVLQKRICFLSPMLLVFKGLSGACSGSSLHPCAIKFELTEVELNMHRSTSPDCFTTALLMLLVSPTSPSLTTTRQTALLPNDCWGSPTTSVLLVQH